MNKIVFATNNEHKLSEIRQILRSFEIIPLKDLRLDLKIEENGKSFYENACIKAKAIWDKVGGIVMADDSGLVIDYLNGEPGIYSARYLGESTSYKFKNEVILSRMKNAKGKERSARFVACIVCILPNSKLLSTQATMEGFISDKISGENGFGYDPILYLPEFACTAAQLDSTTKNLISHRGKALELMQEKLEYENLGSK